MTINRFHPVKSRMSHTFSATDLERHITQLFQAAGSDAAEAHQVASNLVMANLSGHDSHGVGMVPRYIDAILEKNLQPNSRVQVRMDSGMLLGLDGRTAALLAAILGSTDPAALIPTLKQLAFKAQYQRVSDLAVAESALNDAVGAIFTTAVVTMVLTGAQLDSLLGLAGGLFNADNALQLGQQFLFGTLAGVMGWFGVAFFERYKAHRFAQEQAEHSYDFAVVLVVPLLTFVLAQALHGNGFLAAFVVGLLGSFNHGSPEFKPLLHHMEAKIESVAKPTIFMMVGPFVSLSDLSDTLVLGLAIAVLFILVARPLAVVLSLAPTRVSLKEKLFLCAVRETGVIPVVLAVITVAQLPEMTQLMSLTAWVVIWTLTLLPAVTPWWARRLQMVD